MVLFWGLPENTQIKERIYYRSVDLNDIESKEERKRIKKIKKLVALKENNRRKMEYLRDWGCVWMIDRKIPILVPEKKWYTCPHCGKRLLVYQNGAFCQGIFIRCKGCKKTVEIKI